MPRIRHAFWNEDEKRLRAGWRLALQFLLNLGLAFLLLNLLVAWRGRLWTGSAWSGAINAVLFLGATWLAVRLAGRFLDRRLFSDFGFLLGRGLWWAEFGAGLVAGIAMAMTVGLVAAGAGWLQLEPTPASGIPGVPLAGAILLSVLMYTCIGLFEELARAYHIRNLLEGTYAGRLGAKGSMSVAVTGAALISVVMHRGTATYLLYVAAAAAVLGLFYLLTGRMALAAGAHTAYDFMLFTGFGIGAEEGNAIAVLFQAQYEGLLRSTGGGIDLTPTGLALVLVGEAVGLLVMLGCVRLRHGRIGLQEGLATPALRWRE